MILLTLVAVGMLTLSAISLRTSGHGEAMMTARANARLAMMLALGDLQKTMGPDRGISAPASAVVSGSARGHLTGAWESWRWNPEGNDPSPDYQEKADRFRQWLVSTAKPAAAEDPQLPSKKPAGVELVGNTANDGVSNSVVAEKIPVNPGQSRGTLAWAVFDENLKADIGIIDPDLEPELGREVASRTAPHRMRADILSAKLATLREPENLISMETARIPAGTGGGEEIRNHFHDFTHQSIGLATSVTDGRLKTDLSSALESMAPDTGLLGGPTPYFSEGSGAPTWEYLMNHYQKYRDRAMQVNARPSPNYRVPSNELQPSAVQPPSPSRERLLPVIAKLQLVFSLVSHHHHISARQNFLNGSTVNPRGYQNHAVPHLAYDPVITLYNPYDVSLELSNLRIRIWDPPVGFRLRKIDNKTGTSAYYRSQMAAGEYHGLARFQIANESIPSARKFFTLQLTDGTSDRAGRTLKLLPGEVKVYSPRIERNWTWGYETGGGDPRSFFDWKAESEFANKDNRTNNRFGVEAVPGWDARAGLQTDHLSYRVREPATLYDWEKAGGAGVGGYLSLRLTDDVEIEAKPVLTNGKDVGNIVAADLQVDILAGRYVKVEDDILRSYKFTFADPVKEISEDADNPVITRLFNCGDILQAPNDRGLGGKKPFAILEMAARTTRDPLDESKAWLYNNPVVEGAIQNHGVAGAANQSYDVRLISVSSFTSFPGIEVDQATSRGFFGASKTSTEGSSNVPMYRVPVLPAASLGDWVHANLVSSPLLPRVVHAFGNSRAHPLIPANSVSQNLGGGIALDHAYLLNDALWDRFFFSSLTEYDSPLIQNGGNNLKNVIEDVVSQTTPALNPRVTALHPVANADDIADEIASMGDSERARKIAAYFGIRGAFNLNSTSVDAWRAVLSGLREQAVTGWTGTVLGVGEKTPFARMGLPLAGDADTDTDAGADVKGQIRWAGFRALDDGAIETLARAIVGEIKLRGAQDTAPSLSLAEFVNRRPGSAIHENAGLLQTAIDKTGINDPYHALDSKTLHVSQIRPERKLGAVNSGVMNGFSGEGAPPILSQGDIMAALAGFATIRGDTFRIRAYGEALTADGKTVTVRTWCEAVVQRVPEYIVLADDPDVAEADLESTPNKNFGRRFQIVSFRWLAPGEIDS
ncbi:MAG: hypothetical protein H7A48_12500 [Akkermansiaceae bacterium]|nr:hypothetical protein [Akkermansiaceae bacterium]